MLSIKKILIPTDFSARSRVALPYALDLARKFGANLYIIHIFDDNTLNPYYFGKGENAQEFFEQVQENFQAMVNTFLEDIDADGVNIIPILSHGTPFVEIIRFARHDRIDLIVVSTHGSGALKQIMLGSTAEKLLRKSPCAVLTVRHPEFEFEMP
jgi:nucleotide-binding universal stress UspA family protein